ncbi:hypothetical protein [Chitinivibrio alkaliphilus]|uniref:Uncharacterized protein n=1 Tax=Chitinivibrio alkaliphilus ACht1 TaxID=1313304 RepID=U7DAF2_9BACT|nr:hypothetical protein [Chitinivibrio alkaliphilus]ERP31370.1 hypothetical protein CALK_1716 [Chitinivibrio alkaliphilus ACht1]
MKITIFLLCIPILLWAQAPQGFQEFEWGTGPDEISATALGEGWENTETPLFPNTPEIEVFQRNQEIGGYTAVTNFYFYEDQFFQATVHFDFSHLAEYDFNFNVFISVDEYYREIRTQTLTFVNDIYTLLKRRYGRRQPVFKGIDPRNMFARTDNYISQERWNLRYNASEYYKRIITRGYAKWTYPETQIIFSIDISAPDERFDYLLSASSVALKKEIEDRVLDDRSLGL